MDYSQLQVKYLDTPVYSGKLPEIQSEEVSLGNLSYLDGEAEPATALLQEEETIQNPVQNPVKRVITKTSSKPVFKSSQGLSNFNLNFDEALKIGGTEAEQLRSRRNLLTHLAQVESSFNSGRKNKNAPAYGYFQFMQGQYNGRTHNNIGMYGGVDIDTFRNSPVLQIRAANRLANSFMSSFSKTELQRLHNMGWTDNAIIAGAWLGGPGGVKAYAFQGKDRSDGYDSVGKRMKRFNYA